VQLTAGFVGPNSMGLLLVNRRGCLLLMRELLIRKGAKLWRGRGVPLLRVRLAVHRGV